MPRFLIYATPPGVEIDGRPAPMVYTDASKAAWRIHSLLASSYHLSVEVWPDRWPHPVTLNADMLKGQAVQPLQNLLKAAVGDAMAGVRSLRRIGRLTHWGDFGPSAFYHDEERVSEDEYEMLRRRIKIEGRFLHEWWEETAKMRCLHTFYR